MKGFKHHMYNKEKMKYRTDYADRALDNRVSAAFACGHMCYWLTVCYC